jgi:Thioredoxin domain
MRLDIFVAAGCRFCDRATTIAGEIADRFPSINITLVDVAEAGDGLPESVFAVPTYLLDGQLISLGNPAVDELASLIERKAERQPV